jgi:hypothetical protein
MSYFVHYTFSAIEPKVDKERDGRQRVEMIFHLPVFYWIIKSAYSNMNQHG